MALAPSKASAPLKAPGQLKIAIIGCGHMGYSLVQGLLRAIARVPTESPIKNSRLLVTSKSPETAARLMRQIKTDPRSIAFFAGGNLPAIKEASIVIFASPPCLLEEVIQEDGVPRALARKLVISLLSGVTTKRIASLIVHGNLLWEEQPFVSRAIPNLAAKMCASMTVIEENPLLPPEMVGAVRMIFEHVGRIKYLKPTQFSQGTMLASAALGLATVSIKGIMHGCVAEGLSNSDTVEITEQVLKGMAEMMTSSMAPGWLGEATMSQNGYAIPCMFDLDKQGVTVAFAEAMIKGIRCLKLEEAKGELEW